MLDVLGNKVSEACRKTVQDIFARYMLGDKSMLVFVNLNDKEHPQIPDLSSYNFQPPTASAQEAVESMIIEDGESGAAQPEPSSRESSGTEFDFTSMDDHEVRSRV